MSTYFSYLLFNRKAVSGLTTLLTLQAACCNFHNGHESQALRRAVWTNSGRGNIREGSQVGDDSGFSGIPSLHYKPDPGWECSRSPEQAGGAGPSSSRWLIACPWLRVQVIRQLSCQEHQPGSCASQTKSHVQTKSHASLVCGCVPCFTPYMLVNSFAL